jgi:hypothetical protein
MSSDTDSTDTARQHDDVDAETSFTAPTFSFAQEDTVILLVGPEEKSLVAHESYLKLNSDFFKTALKKEWVEGQTRIIKLPEDDTEAMTNYLTFTYGSGLPTTTLKVMPNGGLGSGQWKLLVKLYILGERLLDTPLRNAVIEEIVQLSSLADEDDAEYFMTTGSCNLCYDGTPTGSPLRRLIVDKYIIAGEQDWIEHDREHPVFPAELSQALLAKIASRQSYDEFVDRELKAEDYFV